ncbi:TlpA family protein disulfide reductase [Stutzerimonas nosocomialis]|uniref:TlpA family protein disulfide reductase n=1 Tax=Stutzerimonas nosocomialis TaxID=1056496 RepID=A0A5R9QCE6_9GAMM|nr:TlpA disulfide reductase family protein [Stutzerimonas nosocomialis]TLX62807.1 TlpA family protein disulfide reductase [Stutzerimonas nosocomialis]
MLTLSLGPLTFSLAHLILLGSLALAVLVGWWLGRGQGINPEALLFRLLLLALLVARLAFVARYAGHFAEQPWRVLDIRDGGFIAWPGLVAAALYAGWRLWRDRPLRKPAGVALAVGVGAWMIASFAWQSFEQQTRLPSLTLHTASGEAVELERFIGQPLVINLWATWCPPCRREMPVFAEAQQRLPQVTFLFVNQGEGPAVTQGYLADQGLALDNLLLDPAGELGQRVGSRALPTTLFYDAEGRQRGSHLGELSEASLSRALERLQGVERRN